MTRIYCHQAYQERRKWRVQNPSPHVPHTSLLVDGFKVSSLLCRGWTRGSRRWKRFETTRPAHSLQLACTAETLELPQTEARERRMLWGDLQKKSGGYKRYRGKKAVSDCESEGCAHELRDRHFLAGR